MHAKAYIFTYGDAYNLLGNKIDQHEKGIAIVGSSNLTLSGVTHNTELNVVVSGNNNHDELAHGSTTLWDESAGLRRNPDGGDEAELGGGTDSALRHLHEDAVRAGEGPSGGRGGPGHPLGRRNHPPGSRTSKRSRCGRRRR